MSPHVPPLAANAWLRYDCIRAEIERVAGRNGHLGDVLEIGAGQGGVGTRLALRSRYTGVDLDATSLSVARRRLAQAGTDARVMEGDPDEVLDPHERFDWVCAFEVLEHIRDDRAALSAWVRRLRPGGRILISVPAFADRYGPFDRLAGHFRRYDPDELAQKLTAAGLGEVNVRCYGVPLGYALEWGRNAIGRHRGFPASPDGIGLAADAQNAEPHEPPVETVEELEQATLGSARLFQPGQRLGPAIEAATWPFRLIQRRVTDRGTGLVAAGRLPA